ncbi:MAG: AmmeMemoRadiSam system protein B [Candidatus Micrarchaeia archaeon]
MGVRSYKFAGAFYPVGSKEIMEFVRSSVSSAQIDSGIVDHAYAYQVPHAGYEYSGKIAAYAYKAVMLNSDMQDIESIILIGPNHTGYGAPIAVSSLDWSTPLGIIKNDNELSQAIADNESIFIDNVAHEEEHSLEVQLPFLQYALGSKEKKFVFICMGDQSLEASNALFESIELALKELKRKALIIASSDLNHYEPAEIAARKDRQLLKAMEDLDYAKFNKLIDELNISACGYGPITVAMLFAKARGARKGIILKYGNSGDSTGDYTSVVEYSASAFV